MELKRALEILEYNKDMLTCDMSTSRDPEHQDVSPDYYGKDAEDLYYAIVCVEEYIKNAIPIELIKKEMKQLDEDIKWAWYYGNVALDKMEYLKTWLTIKLEDWEKENADTN